MFVSGLRLTRSVLDSAVGKTRTRDLLITNLTDFLCIPKTGYSADRDMDYITTEYYRYSYSGVYVNDPRRYKNK